MHAAARRIMEVATAEDVAELLGERIDDATVERILGLDPTLDEVSEAVEDLEYEERFGEAPEVSSPKVDEIRKILAELPRPVIEDEDDDDDDDDDSGLRVVEPEELEEPY
jgi:hypothetical protein